MSKCLPSKINPEISTLAPQHYANIFHWRKITMPRENKWGLTDAPGSPACAASNGLNALHRFFFGVPERWYCTLYKRSVRGDAAKKERWSREVRLAILCACVTCSIIGTKYDSGCVVVYDRNGEKTLIAIR